MLVLARPQVADYQEGLSNSYLNLGAALRDTNQVDPARKAYREAIAIKMSLVAAHPKVPSYRYSLAAVYSNLANIQRDEGDVDGRAGQNE